MKLIGSKYTYGVLTTVSMIPFFVLSWQNINLDFYYDEAFSLLSFILVPLEKTVADYVNLNNHFLSNLVNNLYLKTIGIDNLYDLMDYPWIIRAWQLLYTLLTYPLFYYLCKRHMNKYTAAMAVILLSTTIPYYIYVFQVRGYSMSILIMTILIITLWNYEQKQNIKGGIGIAVSIALLLYSMPSNLYVIFGIALYYVIETGIKRMTKQKSNPLNADSSVATSDVSHITRRNMAIIGYLVLGIVLGAVLYSPLIVGILHDKQVKSEGMFYVPTLVNMMPSVFIAFISWRWLVFVIAAAGIIFFIAHPLDKEKDIIRKMSFCVFVLFIPLITSFIRGDRPYDRHFVVLLPLFCIALAAGVYLFITKISKSKYLLLFIIVLSVYSNAMFIYGIHHIKKDVFQDIIEGKTSVSLTKNYYLHHYAPLKLVKYLDTITQQYPRDSFYMLAYYCDRYTLPEYLKKFNFNMLDINKLDEYIHTSPNWLMISSWPMKTQAEFAVKYPDYELKLLNDPLQFHNLFLMTRKSDAGIVQQPQGQPSQNLLRFK